MENKITGYQIVTREQLRKLRSIACNDYKVAIDILAKDQSLEDDINIKNELISRAYGKATSAQKEVLTEVFNLDFMKPKFAEKWEDLEGVRGYYIDNLCNINAYGLTGKGLAKPSVSNRNTFVTEKQALSALAAAQLSQLMKQVNGDWVPDWIDGSLKHTITRTGNTVVTEGYSKSRQFLAFQKIEVRDQFFKNHQQLIKQYYEL